MTNETNAYLYTFLDDHTMTVKEGCYVPNQYYSKAKQGRFNYDDKRWCTVTNEPGEVYYRKLWLPIRNDELATSKYIEYHQRKIEDLEENIKAHKQAIAALKGKKNK